MCEFFVSFSLCCFLSVAFSCLAFCHLCCDCETMTTTRSLEDNGEEKNGHRYRHRSWYSWCCRRSLARKIRFRVVLFVVLALVFVDFGTDCAGVVERSPFVLVAAAVVRVSRSTRQREQPRRTKDLIEEWWDNNFERQWQYLKLQLKQKSQDWEYQQQEQQAMVVVVVKELDGWVWCSTIWFGWKITPMGEWDVIYIFVRPWLW